MRSLRRIVVFTAGLAVVGGCNQLLGIESHPLSGASPDAAATADAQDGPAEDGEARRDGGADADAAPARTDAATDADASLPACGAQLTLPAGSALPWMVLAPALYLVPADSLQASLASVWGANHVYDPTFGFFKTLVPHQPPYDQELPNGLAGAHFENLGCLQSNEVTSPKKLVLSLVVVPTSSATVGASFEVPDEVGPVIVGSVVVTGQLYVNGSTVGSTITLPYPKAVAVYGYPNYQGPDFGYRHLLLDFDLQDLAPSADTRTVNYDLEVTITSDRLQTSPLTFSVRFRIN